MRVVALTIDGFRGIEYASIRFGDHDVIVGPNGSGNSTTAGVETALIDPGKPWQNGADETFNRRFRDECLRLEWF